MGRSGASGSSASFLHSLPFLDRPLHESTRVEIQCEQRESYAKFVGRYSAKDFGIFNDLLSEDAPEKQGVFRLPQQPLLGLMPFGYSRLVNIGENH
jgi:hypothetical protein